MKAVQIEMQDLGDIDTLGGKVKIALLMHGHERVAQQISDAFEADELAALHDAPGARRDPLDEPEARKLRAHRWPAGTRVMTPRGPGTVGSTLFDGRQVVACDDNCGRAYYPYDLTDDLPDKPDDPEALELRLGQRVTIAGGISASGHRGKLIECDTGEIVGRWKIGPHDWLVRLDEPILGSALTDADGTRHEGVVVMSPGQLTALPDEPEADDDIRPICPECESEHVRAEITHYDDDGNERYAVHCTACSAWSGDDHETERAALDEWTPGLLFLPIAAEADDAPLAVGDEVEGRGYKGIWERQTITMVDEGSSLPFKLSLSGWVRDEDVRRIPAEPATPEPEDGPYYARDGHVHDARADMRRRTFFGLGTVAHAMNRQHAEIERLTRERDEAARSQGLLQDEIKALRQRLDDNAEAITGAIELNNDRLDEIERLTRERDEARMEVLALREAMSRVVSNVEGFVQGELNDGHERNPGLTRRRS